MDRWEYRSAADSAKATERVSMQILKASSALGRFANFRLSCSISKITISLRILRRISDVRRNGGEIGCNIRPVYKRLERLRGGRRASVERKRKLPAANSIPTGLCFVGQNKLAAAQCTTRRTCSRPTSVSLNKVRTSPGLRRVSSSRDSATGE